MAPIRTRKQVCFRDQYERPKNKASLTEMGKPDGITILTKKDEVCRFITGTLSRFLKPLEIPPTPTSLNIVLGVQEESTPSAPSSLFCPIQGWVQVIFSMARGLLDRVSLPPAQWIEVPNMELSLNNGMKVCVQIEDSIYGQLLASYLKELGLLELQANGTTDMEMESSQ
ncbi:hypothetical protein LB504_009453 [Fusarium proliferatum]|nr:hypothetical protein LB504_009453 [Fusarium proliferatum]